MTKFFVLVAHIDQYIDLDRVFASHAKIRCSNTDYDRPISLNQAVT